MKTLLKTLIFYCIFLHNNVTKCTAQTTELWGTNFIGGDDSQGRVVKVTSADVVSQAHGFPSAYPGKGESFLKPLNYNGFLYLLSSTGGKFDRGVFTKYDPTTNISTRLFDFDRIKGSDPYGCNLLVYNNKFYGMTTSGGANNMGTIYEFDPVTNIFTKKYDFTSTIGQPYVSRFELANSKFYSCTGGGGANNFGTLFEYDPATNICTKKLDLSNDGGIGRGNLTGMTLFNGKLYGSMGFINNNDGCIFEYDPVTNIYVKKIILASTSLRNFCGKFILNGSVFYASCNQGDGQLGQGAIVEYNPTSNTLTTKIQFVFGTGAGSFGSLILHNGKYYGTNTIGGTNSSGAFFEWDPILNSISNRKYAGAGLGNSPSSGFEIFNNKLYTTCREGDLSLNYRSTLVEWDVATNNITRKFIFGTGDGEMVRTKLLYHDSKVYGTTTRGGTNFNGIIFSKDVNTGAYNQLYQFPNTSVLTSGIVYNPLSVYNNKIYGVANIGGASQSGVGYIFEWDIATAVFTKKLDLSAATGFKVFGQLYLHTDNNFYGISQSGGTNSTGTIFKWNPTTNIYTTIIVAPQGATGGFVASGNLLYVPTLSGGGGFGSVYAFNIATSTGLSVANYNSNLGTAVGEFTSLNGILYTGTTNGSNLSGNILAFNPTTNNLSIAKILSPSFPFGIANLGSGSNGMLAAYNNELYGFCLQGGLYNTGSIFKFNPTLNVFKKLEDHDGVNAQAGNGFIAVQTILALPVKLTYFTAAKHTNTSALIKWQTAHEQNAESFEVQSSTDGVNFKKIGTVTANGNTTTVNNYSFLDYDPKEINYYRLKQIDIDGKYMYTPIRLLNFTFLKNEQLKVYPNPTKGIVTIVGLNNATNLKIIVNITNSVGILVKQYKFSTTSNNSPLIDLSYLSKGIYFVQFVTNNLNSTQRVILQ